MSAVLIVSAGVHSFFRISKHIAPVYELILGCQILVINFIYNQNSIRICKIMLFEYLRWLKWIFLWNFYVYFEYSSFIWSIFLEKVLKYADINTRLIKLTGPKIVPCQCLKLSPTNYAYTVGPAL